MLSGSLLTTTPSTIAPTAPIPVNTAYAVPTGMEFIARESR